MRSYPGVSPEFPVAGPESPVPGPEFPVWNFELRLETCGLWLESGQEGEGKNEGVQEVCLLTLNSWRCSARAGMDWNGFNRARRAADEEEEELESPAMRYFPARFLR